MALLWKNNATGVLALQIADNDVTIFVGAGEGAAFPYPESGNTFYVTLEEVDGNIEIALCTAREGDSLTVLRGQDNTTARAFPVGSTVEARVTAAAMNAFMSKSENLNDVASKPTARTNLGLGTAAVEADTKYNHRANNLSDVANPVTARTNLGLAINTNVQAYHSSLFAISGLGVADGNFIVGNGSTLVMESGATARASLGLGSNALTNAPTISTSAPSGGVDGDVWYRVE